MLLGYFALLNALIGLLFFFSGQVVQIVNKEKHKISRWKEAVDGLDAKGSMPLFKESNMRWGKLIILSGCRDMAVSKNPKLSIPSEDATAANID